MIRQLTGKPEVADILRAHGQHYRSTHRLSPEQSKVMRHLTGLTSHSGASLVVVTHDENVAAWCSRIVRMRDGLIAGAEARA